MRTEYDLTGSQDSRVHVCGLCGKQYYEAILRACPERGGRRVCAYCCRYCSRSYRDGSTWGCRTADAGRKKKDKGAA